MCTSRGRRGGPSHGGVFMKTDASPFLLGWEDIVTAQSPRAQPQAEQQLALEGPTPPTESSRSGEGHRS